MASSIWTHFKKVPKENRDDVQQAECLHCGQRCFLYNSGTSKCWDHLVSPVDQGGHGLAKSVVEGLKKLDVPADPTQTTLDKYKALPEKIEPSGRVLDACIDLITGASLPVSFFENESVLVLSSGD
jgi:hypothetical protein